MTKQDIIEYVMDTPYNTNRAVLSSMLNQLAEGGGGGGSCIVHPVQVTIINSKSDDVSFVPMAGTDDPMSRQITGFYINPVSGVTRINDSSNWLPTLEGGTTNILPVAYVLEGGIIYIIDIVGENYTYTLSGDATKTEVQGMDTIAITGDCTITVS